MGGLGETGRDAGLEPVGVPAPVAPPPPAAPAPGPEGAPKVAGGPALEQGGLGVPDPLRPPRADDVGVPLREMALGTGEEFRLIVLDAREALAKVLPRRPNAENQLAPLEVSHPRPK